MAPHIRPLVVVAVAVSWARVLAQDEQAAPPAPKPQVKLDKAAALFIENRFRKLDADHDGKLSVAEAKPVEFFVAGADADGDGFYTLEEVQTHLQKQGETIRQNLERRSEAAPGRALLALMAPELEERFKALDKDGNGKLVGDELKQVPWLAKVDANGDGVTIEEANEFFATLVQGEPALLSKEAPPPYQPENDSPREEPRVLRAAEAGVGRMIPDVTFQDLNGQSHQLSEFTKSKATVIALVSPTCPVSKRYLPTLARMEAEAKQHGVAFFLVAPTATETPDVLKAAFAAAKLTAMCVPDPKGTLSVMLGAKATTDAIVLDSQRTVVYHGAIDDQYGLGYSLDAPKHQYVVDAVKAIFQGTAPTIAATEAPGCVLDFDKTQRVAAAGEVTYHNRISRVLQTNCVECHRGGGIAPFALETYDQVVAKSGMIRKMVDRRLMPPWFAKPDEKAAHSPWRNDRSLAEQDRTDLLNWIAGGKIEGNRMDSPLPRTWAVDWEIGKPDAIYQIPQPIDVKATGTMPYQNVVVDAALAEDKWVTAIEIQPTAREVVHHVLVFAREPKGRAEASALPRLRKDDDGTNGYFAAYVPGNSHVIYPAGFAKLLPAGSKLQFQIHYTPNGTATQDQVRIALKFGKERPQHVVHVAGIADVRLNIPAGADNHPETASIPVPLEVKLLAFMPHMHVRGKAFRYDLILPDKSERTLLEVPRYDFNWQLSYRYADPVTIPAGSKIRATGWFDNSSNNPANPDPNKTVRWGPQTTDEMMLGYVEYYLPTNDPELAVR